MKTLTNKIKFILALAIICTTFTACSKDNNFGTNANSFSNTGTYALLSGNRNTDALLCSSKFSENFSGTANAIKVDLDSDGKVDLNSFDGELDMHCIAMPIKLNNGSIITVVFPRALLQALVNNPYQVFLIREAPSSNRPYSPGIMHLASL